MEYVRKFRKGYNQSHKVRSPEVRSPEVRSPEVRSTKINQWNMFEDFSTNTRNELATAHGQDPEIGKFHILYAHNLP